MCRCICTALQLPEEHYILRLVSEQVFHKLICNLSAGAGSTAQLHFGSALLNRPILSQQVLELLSTVALLHRSMTCVTGHRSVDAVACMAHEVACRMLNIGNCRQSYVCPHHHVIMTQQ